VVVLDIKSSLASLFLPSSSGRKVYRIHHMLNIFILFAEIFFTGFFFFSSFLQKVHHLPPPEASFPVENLPCGKSSKQKI